MMCASPLPMTLKQRKIYFYALVGVFLVTTPAVILYSQGYTLNLKDFSLNKTGAIFVSTSPKGVRVLLDSELKATTSDLIFSQGKLISHLAPGEYEVKIEKEGYYPWSKHLTVEPQLVTETRNIFLVPSTTVLQTIEENVSDIIFSASNAMIAYIKDDGIAILDVSSPKIIPLVNEKGEKIGKARFGANENYLIIESFLKNKVRKYLFDIQSRQTTEIQEEDEERFVKIRQYPENQPRILALSSANTLYWIDLRSQNEKMVVATNISNFELFGDRILYATTAPTVFYEKNLVSGKTDQLNQTPVEFFDFSSQILRSSGGFTAFINNKKQLYLYANGEKVFKKIGDNVQYASFSDDNKKLMWQNKNEIYVYYLKDIAVQPRKKEGETELITRFSGPIGAMSWFSYDNEHIFFVADGMLKLTELDGRDGRNTVDIALVKKPVRLIYNSFDDFLYLLDGKTFKKITLIKNS